MALNPAVRESIAAVHSLLSHVGCIIRDSVDDAGAYLSALFPPLYFSSHLCVNPVITTQSPEALPSLDKSLCLNIVPGKGTETMPYSLVSLCS